MNTEQMLNGLKPGDAAICEFGYFANDIAVVRDDGVVVLVDSFFEYDFWDARFNDCEWLLVEDPDCWSVEINGEIERANGFRVVTSEDECGVYYGYALKFDYSSTEEYFDFGSIKLIDVDNVGVK